MHKFLIALFSVITLAAPAALASIENTIPIFLVSVEPSGTIHYKVCIVESETVPNWCGPVRSIVLPHLNHELSKQEFFKLLSDGVTNDHSKQCLLFVHGYNCATETAMKTAAELSIGLETPAVAFDWPSNVNAALYHNDEQRAEQSLPVFEALLDDLGDKSLFAPGTNSMFLVSHSMGGRFLATGLYDRWKKWSRNELKSKGYINSSLQPRFKMAVFMSPDISTDDFLTVDNDVSTEVDSPMIFYNPGDRALLASKFAHLNIFNGNSRAGRKPISHAVLIDYQKVSNGLYGHSPPYRVVGSIMRDRRTRSSDIALVPVVGNRYGLFVLEHSEIDRDRPFSRHWEPVYIDVLDAEAYPILGRSQIKIVFSDRVPLKQGHFEFRVFDQTGQEIAIEYEPLELEPIVEEEDFDRAVLARARILSANRHLLKLAHHYKLIFVSSEEPVSTASP